MLEKISKEVFQVCFVHASDNRVEKYYPHVINTCKVFNINTVKRVASFFAQLAHESGSLYYTEEIASGKAYEGRKDLGNNEPGDGMRFKGRGLIQITGRHNYQKLSEFFWEDFIKEPTTLRDDPWYAAVSAGWFWMRKGLNSLADRGDFEMITKLINGGLNGYEDRLYHYSRILVILNSIDDEGN